MTTVREFGCMLAAFISGSSTLMILAYLQKKLFDLPQQQFTIIAKTPMGYIVPFFAGGALGLTIYLLYRRIRQLTNQAGNQLPSNANETSYGMLFTYILVGIIILCLFSTIQKSINGFSLQLKGYILPAIVGTISGLIVGLLQLRIYRLLHQEQLGTSFLQQERDQTLNILASISNGLMVTDDTEHITLINDIAAQMLELPREQIQGKTLVQVMTTATGNQNIINKRINTVGAVNQFTIISNDGSLRSMKGITSALHSSNTSGNSLIMTLHDNTEEQRIDRMKSEFISSATHSLKTPITAITGYTELLQSQQQFTPEQTTEFLNYINDKAWELNALINNLLDINHAEAGQKINLIKDSTSAAPLFDNIRSYCATQNTPCTFSFDVQDSACALYIDQRKINTVVENMVSNAIKFSPAAGTISITGTRANCEHAGYYRISVSDKGIGMSTNQCLRIFDKFYRADSSDSGQQGIGLGLTLAKNIVEAHAGEISATSALGQGTTLSFYLPISDTAEHAN